MDAQDPDRCTPQIRGRVTHDIAESKREEAPDELTCIAVEVAANRFDNFVREVEVVPARVRESCRISVTVYWNFVLKCSNEG